MKQAKSYAGLARKCLMMYGAVGIAAALGMLLSSRFVSHASLQQLQHTIAGVAIGYGLLFVLLLLFTHFRLTVALEANQSIESAEQKQAVWQRLTSFPAELFWLYWLAGTAIAQAYRLFALGLPPWDGATAIMAWKGILFDGSTFFAFAMIHYSLLRLLLHRELQQLDIIQLPHLRFYRMTDRIMLIIACGLIYMVLRLFWYVYQALDAGKAVQWGVFAAIALIVAIVTLAALKLAASYLLMDITRIKDRLLQLRLSQANAAKPIPVVSPYEAGELALAFNSIQHKFTAEYTRLHEEIQLAHQVQQQLFPRLILQAGQWHITGGEQQPAGAAVYFFQLAAPQERHIMLATGAIKASAPSAALIMSSLLMLFRSQVDEGSSAADMLAYFESQLAAVIELHMATAKLDEAASTLEWAATGRVQLVVVKQQEQQPVVREAAHAAAGDAFLLDDVEQFQLHYAEQQLAAYEDAEQQPSSYEQQSERYPLITVRRSVNSL